MTFFCRRKGKFWRLPFLFFREITINERLRFYFVYETNQNVFTETFLGAQKVFFFCALDLVNELVAPVYSNGRNQIYPVLKFNSMVPQNEEIMSKYLFKF